MIVIALAILAGTVWILLRVQRISANQPAMEDHHQLQLVRDRLLTQLNELDTESVDQGVDPVLAGDERRRLEAELARVLRTLDELAASTQNTETAESAYRSRSVTVLAVVIGLPVLGLGVFALNNHHSLAQLAAYQSQSGKQAQYPPMVMQMIARLEQRLAEQPDDPQGWARLGRSYQVLGRTQDAKAAYARAYKLAPDDIDILSNYAVMLYSENQENPGQEVEALFQRLLKLNPNNPSALWVTGLAAYRRGEHARAINLWENLLQQLPKDSPIAPQIQHALAEARTQQKN